MSVFGQLASLLIRPEKDAGFEDTFASRFGAAPLSAEEAAALRQRQFTNRQQASGAERAERAGPAVLGGLADLSKSLGEPVMRITDYSRSRVGTQAPVTEEDVFRQDLASRNIGKGIAQAGAYGLPLKNPLAAVPAQAELRGGALYANTPKTTPAVVQGIRAYHGSPHDFDRFDLSKIGTGEGAQAYGHGLYFAENEKVAKGYRDALIDRASNSRNPQGAAERNWGKGPDEAVANLEGQLRSVRQSLERHPNAPGSDHMRSMEQMYTEALDLVKGGYKPGGRMYEVSLNARPEQFLDWDKSLNAQDPAHRAQLLRMSPNFAFGGDRPLGFFANEPLKNPKHTETLREAGIPGIRYLDQGSRNQKYWVARHPQGGTMEYPSAAQAEAFVKKNPEYTLERPNISSNYVVFDPGIIDILRKYGLAGATAAPFGALAAQDSYEARP